MCLLLVPLKRAQQWAIVTQNRCKIRDPGRTLQSRIQTLRKLPWDWNPYIRLFDTVAPRNAELRCPVDVCNQIHPMDVHVDSNRECLYTDWHTQVALLDLVERSLLTISLFLYVCLYSVVLDSRRVCNYKCLFTYTVSTKKQSQKFFSILGLMKFYKIWKTYLWVYLGRKVLQLHFQQSLRNTFP